MERGNSNEIEYLKRDEILGPLTLHGTKGYLSKVKINHYDTMSIYRDKDYEYLPLYEWQFSISTVLHIAVILTRDLWHVVIVYYEDLKDTLLKAKSQK